MTVYVFTGPTLSAADARPELDAVYLPPAAQGDVYRVARRHPVAIGIVDGYFERVPSVWHKEILWAMSQGVHVFGSASMGALRAAELAAFGMRGVGDIFERYRDGRCEADDEVAVIHGPAESLYVALSEAMVNIRSTLSTAEAAGIISSATLTALLAIAKSMFYPQRAYQAILGEGAAAGLPQPELRALEAWLPLGRVDQKRLDAIAMLREMRGWLDGSPGPMQVGYVFEQTVFWDQARLHAGESQVDSTIDGLPVLLDDVVEELRLDPDAFARARQGAALRVLALELSEQRTHLPDEVLRQTLATFRRERGLLEAKDVERWLQDQGLDLKRFGRLIEQEARLRSSMASIETDILGQLPDYLRVTGEYARLVTRARVKQRALQSLGVADPQLSDAGVTYGELQSWYFEQRLGQPVPPDLNQSVQKAGFLDESQFERAALREFLYANLAGSATGSARLAAHAEPPIQLPGRTPASTFSPLEDVIYGRRSADALACAPLSLEALATILRLGDGLVVPPPSKPGVRTAPSAGGLYPIDLYCISLEVEGLPAGVHRYDPVTHTLVPHLASVSRPQLAGAVPDTMAVAEASACLALCANLSKTAQKYGARAYRFALLEAGHIAQNLLLAAHAHGVDAIPVGGFLEGDVNQMLGLDGRREFATYLVVLGGGARRQPSAAVDVPQRCP